MVLDSGYMAPEYAMHGQLSVKLDVFSFGVLMLELVSGQKNSSYKVGEKVTDLVTFVSCTHKSKQIFRQTKETR